MQDFDNSFIGFRGDAITVKLKDGCQQPYLSMDRNHFRMCTTRPLGEHLRQVLKKSDQWSLRRCDNKIVTVVNKGQTAILMMAIVWPYLLMDRNCFWADISRNWEEFICKVSVKFLQWFWRRRDNGENQSLPLAAIFVDGRNYIQAATTRPPGEHLGQV